VLSAVLFVPVAVAVFVLSLAEPNAGNCLENGQCTPGLPGYLIPWALWTAAGALLVALAAPWRQARVSALTVQLTAEGTALLVILLAP
jgi:hypothetical protein